MTTAAKPTPLSQKIIAILLCKGDLSDEPSDADPCSTLELFRFASAKHKVYFVIGLICTAITGALTPLNQILNGSIADIYLREPNPEGNDSVLEAIMLIVYFYVAATVIQFVLNFVQQYLLLTVTNEVVDRMRREYVSAVLRLDAASLDETSPGKLSSELNENIDKIRDGMGEKFALVVRSIFIFLFSLLAAFIYNWKVSLLLLPLGPIGAVVTGLTGKYTARLLKDQMDMSASGSSLVEEAVMNVKTVAACNGQRDMVKRYQALLDRLISLGARICLLNGFFEGLLFFVIYLFGMACILIAVPDTFTENGFSAGSVIISFGSVLLGAYFLGLLGPHMMTLLKARISAAVIYQTIDKASKLDAPSDEPIRERLRGSIEFIDVHFKYPTRDAMVLKGLSWSAKEGQAVAFAGHSGCGKSTSIGLLTKLYECCEGEITIDGRNIKEFDRNTLRKNIGMVAQEPCLFNGTIRENILLGRKWRGKGTTEQRLQEVAAIAQARHFIDKLHDGFETVLGEGGIMLSGGQKQRIAIARAIFMDPSILILDEATSALDVHSERLVQTALNDASVGRTTITIAHRLSTLKDMDAIYVVDKGVVIEQGTHGSLLATGGTYARMAERQSLAMDDKKKKETLDNEIDFSRVRSRRSSRLSNKVQPSDLNGKQVEVEISNTKQSSFLRVYTHGHLSSIIPAFIFSILRGLEIPLYNLLMALLYNSLNSTEDEYWSLALWAAGASLAIGIYVWFVNTMAYYFSGKASESVMASIKERILDRVLHRNAEYFDQQETSNATIVTDMNQQPAALFAALDGRAVLFVWCTNTLIVCNIFALAVCWMMGLIIIALTIVVLTLLFILFLLHTNFVEKHSRLDESPQLALEIFSQTRTIQIMAVENYFQRKYTKCQEAVNCIQIKCVVIQSVIWSISNGCIYLFGLLGFGVGSHLVYNGYITGELLYLVGMSIEFSAYALAFINPTFPDLVRANAAARILYSYFDLPEPIDIGDSKKELSGEFSVRNLDFAYPTRRNQKVAQLLNISAAAGESIALVGPSGCGKSTIISLIERFYEQQAGSIKLDGIDHRQLSVHHLRTQIALVGQEPVLFQGSIIENVLLGCSESSLEEARVACRLANAANFIEDLPDGYDTEVGTKGRSLSGGQKQRIAIARALVRKPKILLLDEATSALDGESERIVQEAIAKATAGRTSISIAHRLATIKDATRIYFIDEGSVIECGNHEELINLNGKYASYVKAQSLESS